MFCFFLINVFIWHYQQTLKNVLCFCSRLSKDTIICYCIPDLNTFEKHHTVHPIWFAFRNTYSRPIYCSRHFHIDYFSSLLDMWVWRSLDEKSSPEVLCIKSYIFCLNIHIIWSQIQIDFSHVNDMLPPCGCNMKLPLFLKILLYRNYSDALRYNKKLYTFVKVSVTVDGGEAVW